MTIRSRRLSRTLIAVTAAAGTVVTLAPTAQAAPSPQVPRSPLGLKPTTTSPVPQAARTLPASPVATVESSTVTRWVSVPVANVRSGPSTSYKVLGTKTSGAKVTGVVTSNGWLKMAGGQYMADSVLTASNPGGASSSTVTQYVTAEIGNVRSGPSLSSSVIDTLTRGTKVTGTWTNGWLDMGNGRFMGGSILSSVDPDAGSSDGGTSATTVTRWVSVPVANVRSGPSTAYRVVGTKTSGTKVTGVVTSNGWLKMAGGQYMSDTVLTATNPGGGGGSVTTVTQYVTAEVGNVRSGPSLNHSIVGTLTRGTKVTGTWTNGWLDLRDGRFISGGILSATNPGSGDTGATTVTRWVAAPVANVRSGPSTSYSVVGTKNGGTKVTGTLTSNGWLKLSGSAYMSPGVLTSTAPAPAPAPPAPGDLTPLRQALLDTAAQYVGAPYVLYGTPPEAFDCSAYTWYVYKLNGITIPRTVRDQKAFVVPVSDPQPGDLIFYNDHYHVGIYAGPGMTYEALNPDADVRYGQPVSTNVWYGRVPGM